MTLGVSFWAVSFFAEMESTSLLKWRTVPYCPKHGDDIDDLPSLNIAQ